LEYHTRILKKSEMVRKNPQKPCWVGMEWPTSQMCHVYNLSWLSRLPGVLH